MCVCVCVCVLNYMLNYVCVCITFLSHLPGRSFWGAHRLGACQLPTDETVTIDSMHLSRASLLSPSLALALMSSQPCCVEEAARAGGITAMLLDLAHVGFEFRGFGASRRPRRHSRDSQTKIACLVFSYHG